MKEIGKNIHILDISIILFSITIFIPAFQFFVPQLIRYILLFSSVLLMAYVVLKDRILTNEILVLILGCMLFSTLLYISNSNYASYYQSMIWYFEFWYGLVLSVAVARTKEYNKELLFFVILVLLLFTTHTTISGNQEYEFASRLLASGNYIDEALLLSKNIGGYGFVYGLVLMVPCILDRSKEIDSRIGKMFYYVIVGYFLYGVFVTQYMISVILIMLAIIIHLFKCIHKQRNKVLFIIIVAIIIIGIITFNDLIANWFLELSNSITNYDSIKERIYSLYELFSGEGLSENSDASDRIHLYKKSIETCLSYPLIGTYLFKNQMLIGGHSDILDSIAGTGILGIVVIGYVLKNWKKAIINSFEISIFDHYKTVILIAIIIAFVNTVYTSFQVGFVVFLMPLISMKECDKDENC